MRQTKTRLLVFLAACIFSILASAAPPDYVTAWPRQVPLEKPDPVLGDRLYWEQWVYGEAFAKRFKGFPIDKAEPGMSEGIQAMVLRVFMRNVWQFLNRNYPKQYVCEVDIYFENTRTPPLPLSEHSKKNLAKDPNGITPSYRRLDAYEETDKVALGESQPSQFVQKRNPVVFATPLDGRFATFGIREYHPSLVPGLSLISLVPGPVGYECEVTAPLQSGGRHWLSLFGERPWDKTESGPPKARHGQYDRNVNALFDSGHNPETRGYFPIPEAFNKVALPKAALIKVLNWCISKKDAHAKPVTPMPVESWEAIAYRCELAEQEGKILPDPQYHLGKKSLQEFGF
ncbi:MAG TPA: hypothetical protein VJ654_11995 [Noviherbaspirillum sp.]|nr:hypothetical protein [Noviherbaspirillum sp.]